MNPTLKRNQPRPMMSLWASHYRPLYQMRHTFATLALAASADIYWVSKQLGHESIRTTLKHYARFVPAVDERNMRLLDDFAAQAAADVSNACHAEEANRTS